MSASQNLKAWYVSNRRRLQRQDTYCKTLDNRRASIHEKEFARAQLDQMRAETLSNRTEVRRLQFLADCEAMPLASAIIAVIRDHPESDTARALAIVRELL